MKSIQEALQWRYAVKKMTGEPVSEDKVQEILHAAHYAPSSSGLMPFKVIVVKSQELKEQIKPIAYNQSQITDASHVLVFASWNSVTVEKIEEAYAHMNAERGLPAEATADYVNNLIATYTNMPVEAQQTFTSNQSYISFGFALLAAAQLGVDTTPMEGFDRAALDKILGLEELGLKSQTMIAIGHRDVDNDWLAGMKKVRPAKDEFFIEK